MIGRHLSEERLEQLTSDTPSRREEAHLEGCKACRRKLMFLKRFQANFSMETRQPVSPVATRFVRSRRPNTIIELHRFEAEPERESLVPGSRTVILAAYGETNGKTAPKSKSMVYASEIDGVMIRILPAAQKQLKECYVLSEDRSKRQHVLLTVGEEGRTILTIATDANGIAAFEEKEPVNWDQCVLALHLPVRSITFEGSFLTDQSGHKRGQGFDFVQHEAEVTCRLTSEHAETIRYAGVILRNGNLHLKNVVGGEFSFSNQEAGQTAELRLFS
jgi:hypothetical protein